MFILKVVYYIIAVFAGFFMGVAASMFVSGEIISATIFALIVLCGYMFFEDKLRTVIFGGLNSLAEKRSRTSQPQPQTQSRQTEVPVETVRYNLLREIEVLASFIEHQGFKENFQVLHMSVKSLRKSYRGVQNQFLNREDACSIVKESIESSFNHVMKATKEFVENFKFFDPDSNAELMAAAARRDDEEHRVEYEGLEEMWLLSVEAMLKIVGEADVQMKKIMMSQGNYTAEDSELYLEALQGSLKDVRQGLW